MPGTMVDYGGRGFASGFDGWGSKLAELPMEILIQIFGYLSPWDRVAAGQTCKRLFDVTQHHRFMFDMRLHLWRTNFSQSTAPVSFLLDSSRHFSAITLYDVQFGEPEEYFDRFGANFDELRVIACDMRVRTLCEILKRVPNLRTLSLDECRELFMCDRLFETAADRAKLKETLKNVTVLSLNSNAYLADAQFHRIMEIMPAVQQLSMAGCLIAFHKGIAHRFYPNPTDEPRDSVLTFHCISQWIAERAQQIRSLDFSSTLIDGNALEQMCAMEHLQLERLVLQNCQQLTTGAIQAMLKTQTHLQHLDLTKFTRLSDDCLSELCQQLPELRTLKLRGCQEVTNRSIQELRTLRALEVLDISHCVNVSDEGILQGIASQPNPALKELYVGGLNLCDRSVIAITESCRSLRVLDLSYCLQAVSDFCVQLILKYLPHLRYLNLYRCKKISDGALTGLGMRSQMQQYEADRLEIADNSARIDESALQVLKYAMKHGSQKPAPEKQSFIEPPAPYRISLRSRAEQEIVNDAMRNKAMMKMCQQSALDAEESSGYSITRLGGLRVLRLGECNKLSDVSLLYNFKLLDLHEISLNNCQQISSVGIKALVENCPSLAIVDLASCNNIDDHSVLLIVSRLPRLHTLSLQNCHQLTDHSLDHIAIHCRALNTLNVRGCRNMCTDPEQRLTTVTSLRTVLVTRSDCLLDSPMADGKIIPPPPRF